VTPPDVQLYALDTRESLERTIACARLALMTSLQSQTADQALTDESEQQLIEVLGMLMGAHDALGLVASPTYGTGDAPGDEPF
jgi:hypothetical protein